MKTNVARRLFERYAAGVVYVCTKSVDETESIGTAFHVGEGVFVTARHVVEGRRITEVRSTTSWCRDLTPDELDERAEWRAGAKLGLGGLTEVTNIETPVAHPDDRVDVAAFKGVPGSPLPTIPLGGHLDDWVGDEFLLSSGVVMGYPPIPFAREPLLVCVRAEVNAIVDKRNERSPHFVMSATARGGFSGGVALSEWGFALGMITEALTMDGQPIENGFLAVLSVEPIYDCLKAHNMLPKRQTLWMDAAADREER